MAYPHRTGVRWNGSLALSDDPQGLTTEFLRNEVLNNLNMAFLMHCRFESGKGLL